MKTYLGIRDLDNDRCVVTVDGEPLAPRNDLVDYSPDGFEWGYWGAGPAQLALAILADVAGDEVALELHQLFKKRAVGKFGSEWRLTEAMIRGWIAEQGRALDASPTAELAVSLR